MGGGGSLLIQTESLLKAFPTIFFKHKCICSNMNINKPKVKKEFLLKLPVGFFPIVDLCLSNILRIHWYFIVQKVFSSSLGEVQGPRGKLTCLYNTWVKRVGGGGAGDWFAHWVHRLAMVTFWRVFHHDGKASPTWCGWGGHALRSLYLKLQAKLWCMLQLRGQICTPISPLPLSPLWMCRSVEKKAEPVLLNVYGAPKLIPSNEFRQPM